MKELLSPVSFDPNTTENTYQKIKNLLTDCDDETFCEVVRTALETMEECYRKFPPGINTASTCSLDTSHHPPTALHSVSQSGQLETDLIRFYSGAPQPQIPWLSLVGFLHQHNDLQKFCRRKDVRTEDWELTQLWWAVTARENQLGVQWSVFTTHNQPVLLI